jgi:hypothetical protein
MLAIALPRFQVYAERHGYELVADRPPTLDPPSWGKVPLLLDLLRTHEAVLWLDCDVLIRDATIDIAHDVPPSRSHGLVTHITGEGRIPNCGVWYVRRAARPLLEAVLERYEKYKAHPWWEQAAVIELLPQWPAQPIANGWNWHIHDRARHDAPRFAHFTALPDRLGAMRQAARDPLKV